MSIALIGGALEVFDALPDTNLDLCHADLLEGRYWDASFDCPALTFARGIFGPGDEEEDDDEGDET
jgi:hypothetical protein